MPTLKAVLDTNVWLDIFLFQDEKIQSIIDASAQKRIQIYACKHMYNELERVLTYRQFDKYHHNIKEILLQFNNLVIYLDNPSNYFFPLKCKDKDDQIFLDFCAIYNIDFLISKDKQVLKLAKGMLKFAVNVIPPNLFCLI